MSVDFAFSAMAARSDLNPAPWRRPFIRWLDGVEARWSVPLLLVCFVALWTAYLSIAYAGSGLHPDFLETWTLGRHFAWGNPKHPPLMGWVTGAWTSIFPSVDWSLHLMAMTNAALALWVVDLISKRFVTGHKRLLVLLLLMLTPAYQFHAQRFNANAVTSLQDSASFVMGLAAAMSLSAVTWVMIAGYRLRRLPEDFAAMDPGLRLLFYIAIGTIALPVATSLVVGTDLPSLWALQGVFLFAVLIVCGTNYPIERFYTVNATILVAGIAVAAVVIAAPLHAIYRNSYGYEEGRNFYRQAAGEVTRQWHELTSVPFSRVSGDDALAFATAFYSPDHPYYARPFAKQYTWPVPRKTTLERGWAGLCFHDQPDCLDWMDKTATRAEKFVRSEFIAQAQLLGMPGVSRKVVWLIVPPEDAQAGEGSGK